MRGFDENQRAEHWCGYPFGTAGCTLAHMRQKDQPVGFAALGRTDTREGADPLPPAPRLERATVGKCAVCMVGVFHCYGRGAHVCDCHCGTGPARTSR